MDDLAQAMRFSCRDAAARDVPMARRAGQACDEIIVTELLPTKRSYGIRDPGSRLAARATEAGSLEIGTIIVSLAQNSPRVGRGSERAGTEARRVSPPWNTS
jgi:hypothetical protein